MYKYNRSLPHPPLHPPPIGTHGVVGEHHLIEQRGERIEHADVHAVGDEQQDVVAVLQQPDDAAQVVFRLRLPQGRLGRRRRQMRLVLEHCHMRGERVIERLNGGKGVTLEHYHMRGDRVIEMIDGGEGVILEQC